MTKTYIWVVDDAWSQDDDGDWNGLHFETKSLRACL